MSIQNLIGESGRQAATKFQQKVLDYLEMQEMDSELYDMMLDGNLASRISLLETELDELAHKLKQAKQTQRKDELAQADKVDYLQVVQINNQIEMEVNEEVNQQFEIRVDQWVAETRQEHPQYYKQD